MQDEDAVETDQQSDFSDDGSGTAWANSWQSFFFTLYCLVMSLSLLLYLCLLRAMAIHRRSPRQPQFFLLLLLFFTSLVEDALIVQQFMMLHLNTSHTTSLCQLFTYAVYGNKILQASCVTTMLYYAWINGDKKELLSARQLSLLTLTLLLGELLLTIWPAVNLRGAGGQCQQVDNSFATERRTGWLYLVLLPYFLPLVACLFPGIRLCLQKRKNCDAKVAVSIASCYFLFHLLYYTLMLGRESEALVLDRSEWRRLLGLHVWYITRPVFALIAYGWHVIVPLVPFAFDSELRTTFPGNWINRARSDVSTRGRQEVTAAPERGFENVLCMEESQA